MTTKTNASSSDAAKSSTASSVVTISYHDLLSPQPTPDLLARIGQAYGDDGETSSLGILAITDVPNFLPLRSRLLPLAAKVATLPKSELTKIECPEAGYQVGWSHGKEKVEGDKYDVGKGSFYFNPLVDDLLQAILNRRQMMKMMHTSANVDLAENNGNATNNEPVDDEELKKVAQENPAFFAPNVWPDESLPELEEVAKEMGTLICNVGRLVARLCDGYVQSRCPGYSKGKLESVLTQSLCCKARLLHYFPVDEIAGAGDDTNATKNDNGATSEGQDEDDTDFSTWCGWHNDHGSLTGLVPAMYVDADGKEVSSPDPAAGLYIKSRSGDLVHVKLPSNALAFQVGETSQVHTGGILQATPHAVRGCSADCDGSKGVSRETFAIFMEPEYHGDMSIPQGRTVEDTQRKEVEEHLPKSVRVLRSRWNEGMNFGEFSHATFEAFH